jgi:hypothetical protein
MVKHPAVADGWNGWFTEMVDPSIPVPVGGTTGGGSFCTFC